MRLVFTETRSIGLKSRWLNLDTADARTVYDGDLDVAIVTPVFAPRVFDKPVLLAVVVAPTDGEHGVVLVGSAIFVVHDTIRVVLEATLFGINSDSDRPPYEGGLQLVNAVLLDVIPLGDVDVSLMVVSFARVITTVIRFVRVVILSGGIGELPEVISLFDTASPAAAACAVAGDLLLLGEGNEVPPHDPIPALECASSCERPA